MFLLFVFFFFYYTATPEIYTYLHSLSLHYDLPISVGTWRSGFRCRVGFRTIARRNGSKVVRDRRGAVPRARAVGTTCRAGIVRRGGGQPRAGAVWQIQSNARGRVSAEPGSGGGLTE